MAGDGVGVVGFYSTYIAIQSNTIFSTLRYHFSYLIVTRFNNMNSFYQCTALIIPIMTTLLQLKYQGADQSSSPFATHPRTMRVAASSSAVYYLAYIAVARRPFDVAARVSLICCGYASVSSLASLLFPAAIRVYVHLIFVLISAAELWYYYKRAMDEEEGVDFAGFLNNLRRVATINPFGRRDRLLPV